MLKLALAFSLATVFVLSFAEAGELNSGSSSNGDRTEESFIENFAIGGSYLSWTGDSDFSNGGGSVSQYEIGVEANAPILMREGFRPTAGVQLAQEIEIDAANYNFQQDLDTAAFATGGVRLRF